MRSIVAFTLVLVIAVAAWMVTNAGAERFCGGYQVIPGGPVIESDGVRLVTSFPVKEREGGPDCFFSHFDDDDLERFDGAVFHDCVIWMKDGTELVADSDIECAASGQ